MKEYLVTKNILKTRILESIVNNLHESLVNSLTPDHLSHLRAGVKQNYAQIGLMSGLMKQRQKSIMSRQTNPMMLSRMANHGKLLQKVGAV
jgi:hypothetical protein